ncbi:MAG: hypothetical protein JWR61_2709 [Ferruginibacter sp.]|nr:hypothetical protein [Ferruginibacter sp.]
MLKKIILVQVNNKASVYTNDKATDKSQWL